jgi:hypothetical protein
LLGDLGATVEGAEDFDPNELPDPLDPSVLAEGGNWVLETSIGRLDLMQWSGEQELWEKLAPGAIEDEIAGIKIKMVGYEDLVRLKELAGRPEDLMDLERLRAIRED